MYIIGSEQVFEWMHAERSQEPSTTRGRGKRATPLCTYSPIKKVLHIYTYTIYTHTRNYRIKGIVYLARKQEKKG